MIRFEPRSFPSRRAARRLFFGLGFLAVALPAAAQPSWWRTVMNSGDASFFDYYDTPPYKTEAAGFSLPWTFHVPAAVSGCTPPSCLALCTYPNSAPYFFSSDCRRDDGSPPWNGDCTGTHQVTGTTDYSRSTSPYPGVKGFRFYGMFYGSAWSSSDRDYVVESAFVHEQPCYAGHAEYGFARILGRPAGFFFYWSTDTNCDGAICRRTRNVTDTPVNASYGTRSFGFDPNQPYIFEASIVPFRSGLGFHVKVTRYSDGAVVYDDTFDPNDTMATNYPMGSPPFPIGSLNGASLYTTATIVKQNRDGTLFASDPALRADAVQIGQ